MLEGNSVKKTTICEHGLKLWDMTDIHTLAWDVAFITTLSPRLCEDSSHLVQEYKPCFSFYCGSG